MKKFLSLVSIIPVIIIQTALFPHFSGGWRWPQLLLAVVFTWCLLKDYSEALLWAVGGGIMLDLFSTASFGVSALTLVGVVVILYFILQNIIGGDKLYSRLWLGGVAVLVYYIFFIFLTVVWEKVFLSPAKIAWSSQLFLLVGTGVVVNLIAILIIYPLIKAGYQWAMKFEYRHKQKI